MSRSPAVPLPQRQLAPVADDHGNASQIRRNARAYYLRRRRFPASYACQGQSLPHKQTRLVWAPPASGFI